MSETPVTQADQILAALRRGARLTGWDAARDFYCLNLPQRIHDLRLRGVEVKGEYITAANGKRFMQYFIPQKKSTPDGTNPLF